MVPSFTSWLLWQVWTEHRYSDKSDCNGSTVQPEPSAHGQIDAGNPPNGVDKIRSDIVAVLKGSVYRGYNGEEGVPRTLI